MATKGISIVRAYIGLLEEEPGTAWGIWFPDLPSCVSAGETSDAAMGQVGEALEQWMECSRDGGLDVPPPRTLEELRGDPEVAEDLDKGDTPVLVALPEQALGSAEAEVQAIGEAAAKQGLTRSDFVRRAVLEKIAS